MSRRPIWQTVFERFDPERPAETDAPAWRADRPLSPTEAIVEALDLPFGTPRVILTGTMGTGKTTELLRISEKRAEKEFVVFLNLERHFQEVVHDPAALQNVSAWEVCFLAGVALLRSAEERLGFTFPEAHLRDLEQAWTALARSSRAIEVVPEVDVAKLAKAMVLVASTAAPLALGPPGVAATAGLAALGAAAEAAKWSLPFGRKKERVVPDADPEIQSLVRCVNVLIGLVRQRAGRVLLVLDGLDRIEEFDRAKELFIDSQVIGELDCRVVLCGPFVLRRHGAILNVRGFSNVPPLVSVPVLDHKDPSRLGPGIPFFHALFARRTADLGAPALVPPALLDRLAYYSGGRAREFVTAIRKLSERAWTADADVATEALVDAVLDERRRRREMGLHRGHIRVLETIANDPEHQLPEDNLVQNLIRYGSLLPYPDGSEWYYPHPLLMMRFIRLKPAGSN